MNILLGIEGGIGKNITATGAVKIAAELGHKVDIITAWPNIWQGNPYVNKIWDWSRSEYLFENIKTYDKIVFDDPYRQSKFLLGETNLTGTWNYMLNEIVEPVKPEVYLTMAEDMYVKTLLQDLKKPIMVIQTNGGTEEGYAWTRDIPLEEAVEILNPFAEEYDIIHLRSNNQLEINGTMHIANLDIRQALVVLQMSTKRLLIDSIYQHAAAAFELESVVLWVMTEPEKFGHELHTNIKCNEPELRNTDRLEMLFRGLDSGLDKCPFSPGQKIFDTGLIIDKLK